MERNKILLLGGTGTLSSVVLKKLLKENWDVWILNRGLRKKNVPDEVHVIIGDFKNPMSWSDKISKESFLVVVDFLSRTPDDIMRIYPLFKDKCQQYVFISSSCVYRRNQEDFPIKESSPKPNVNWSYNIEKYNAELALIKQSEDASSSYTIIRPYITYDNERIPFGIAPAYKFHRTILERLKSNKPVFVWEGGEIKTTLTYVDDFANGVIGLLLNEKAFNEDFHITSNFTYSWNEFWQIIKRATKSQSEVIKVTSDEICKVMPLERGTLMGDRALDAIFDNSKLKQVLPDFQFKCSLEEGIKYIINNYNSNDNYFYDYKYDALLDKLLNPYSKKVSFKRYKNSKASCRLLYCIYRYLPFRLAQKLCTVLKIR